MRMLTTLEEERRELWEGLLDGMGRCDDPDCSTACRRLLRHLVKQTSVCPAGAGRGRSRVSPRGLVGALVVVDADLPLADDFEAVALAD